MNNILRFTQVVIEIEQLKIDNIVNLDMPAIYISLAEVMSLCSDEPLESTRKS